MTSVRRASDADAQDLFGLLALCFAEYPGCLVDPHDDLADLRRPGASFAGDDAVFLVVEDEGGRICACAAVAVEAGEAEMHRLYVRPDRRRAGLAAALVERLEAFARERGAPRIALWSDTRFHDAHRFYERRGYRTGGTERALGDVSGSVERHFVKNLG